MAITTLDGLVAGFQPARRFHKANSPTLVIGRPHSYWASAGVPGAGSYNGTLNGVVLDSSSALVSGQIPHFNPGSGNAYLARFAVQCGPTGLLSLCDRLWHNGGFTITSTSAQTITSPTWPARDIAGSTNGDGVMLAVEVSANVGAGTPTITVSYTNQAGTSGRTGTNILATVASPVAGAVYLIGLQAGDTGVRSVQSLTLSATWTSGTINLVAYRELASIPINTSNSGNAIDFISGAGQRLYDGVVPYLMLHAATTTAGPIMGYYAEAWG